MLNELAQPLDKLLNEIPNDKSKFNLGNYIYEVQKLGTMELYKSNEVLKFINYRINENNKTKDIVNAKFVSESLFKKYQELNSIDEDIKATEHQFEKLKNKLQSLEYQRTIVYNQIIEEIPQCTNKEFQKKL